jgi:hypothetical protein
MPRVSHFYGIAVYLYYSDHAPPHFHAIYAEHEAEVEIATATILDGTLPRRARSLVTEWAAGAGRSTIAADRTPGVGESR